MDQDSPRSPRELPFANLIPKYMYLSIPLLGGCIVGLLVWALVLLFSSCPSQQQIDAAPSIRSYQPQPRPSSGGGGIIKRPLTDLDAENIRRIMRGEEPLPAPGSPPTQPPSPQPEVGSPETSVPAPVPREKTREYLTNLRLRAKFRAAKAGYYCGLIAGIFGYVALGYYFYQTFKNRPPEQSWRDVVQPSSEGPVDGTPYPYETAPEPAGDRPPGEQSFEPPPGDGILYEDEDFEVPPDASEPDRQEKKDSPGETA